MEWYIELAEFNTAANNDGKPTTKIITGSWQVVGRTREGGEREVWGGGGCVGCI
jgi:hypothetical protein